MIRSPLLLAALLAAAVSSEGAGAQTRLPVQPPIRQLTIPPHQTRDSQPAVPREYRPPPGMCRVWLEGVPASQQPAPTDCASAVRNRPNNGRVLFGDDYVDKKERGKEKRPERPDGRAQAPAAPVVPEGMIATVRTLALGGARVHGPNADDAIDLTLDARHELVSGVVASEQPRQPPRARADSIRDRRRAAVRDSTLSARRRALRDSVQRARRGDDRDDDDDDPDVGDGRVGTADRRAGDGRDGIGRGYYPPYPPPARANGICLDRDGDGWCDDSRFGNGYCLDRDGDGRCDDYPELASAPYSSAMPPMAAAIDVRDGRGSATALRWLGTAEVIVRTSELRRTGTPYRAMWLDASTNQLLQVWTDRDGDGIADRVEIYRNGRVAKILGR